MKPKDPLGLHNLVQPHFGVIGAAILVKCQEKKIPPIHRNWLFSTPVNYGLFTVVEKSKEYDTPFVCIMNYQTKWGVN